MITTIYWPVLFDDKGKTALELTIEFQVHLVGTILLFIDLCVSAFTMRFLHFVFPLLYGAMYVIFSLVYYAAGGVTASGSTAIYPILDWGNKPLETVGIVALAGVLGLIGYSLFYGVYRLRVKIFVKYFGNNDQRGANYTEA